MYFQCHTSYQSFGQQHRTAAKVFEPLPVLTLEAHTVYGYKVCMHGSKSLSRLLKTPAFIGRNNRSAGRPRTFRLLNDPACIGIAVNRWR